MSNRVTNLSNSLIRDKNRDKKRKEKDPPPLPPPFLVSDHVEEEENIFVDIWNRIVQNRLRKKTPQIQYVRLTSQRKHEIHGFVAEHSSRNDAMYAWGTYCKTIVGCDFLMGGSPSGFRVSLDLGAESSQQGEGS